MNRSNIAFARLVRTKGLGLVLGMVGMGCSLVDGIKMRVKGWQLLVTSLHPHRMLLLAATCKALVRYQDSEPCYRRRPLIW